MRPHQFNINNQPQQESSVRARVMHFYPAGFQIKVELQSDLGNLLEVEVSPDLYHSLTLAVGSYVFVSPKEVKIFAEDYQV